jgi:hypothetical protein
MTARGWLLLGAVAAIALALLVGYASDPFGWRRNALAKAQQGQATAAGQAAVATGQSAAATDAAAIADAGRARDTRTIIIRETNRDAIRTAPGADARLDPELVRRARLGLCRFGAYADDAGCAEMRAAGAAELPPARAGGGAATP